MVYYQICQKYINLSWMFNRQKVWFLFFLLLLLVKKISQADLRAGLWTEQT